MRDTLDRIDRQILTRLQQDGRLSNKELAAAVGLAPSTCLSRVKRLQAGGHLRGFHADVAPASLGIGLQAMAFVQLERHTAAHMTDYRARVQVLPEVVASYHVAGQHDFIIHIVARDAAHLRDVIFSLSQPPVQHIQTALIFEHQRTHQLPDFTR